MMSKLNEDSAEIEITSITDTDNTKKISVMQYSTNQMLSSKLQDDAVLIQGSENERFVMKALYFMEPSEQITINMDHIETYTKKLDTTRAQAKQQSISFLSS